MRSTSRSEERGEIRTGFMEEVETEQRTGRAGGQGALAGQAM